MPSSSQPSTTSEALRSATRESVVYRFLLLVLALLCLVSYWQLDLALQTLRAVSTPQGSTSFLAKNMRMRIRDVTLLTSSSLSSSSSSVPRRGERVVLDSVSGIAKPHREAATLPASINSATATRDCDSGTRFAFAPGTLALWCVAPPILDSDSATTSSSHEIPLRRLDGESYFHTAAKNTSSSSSSVSGITSSTLMSVANSGGAPIAAPFRPAVPPNPNSVEVVDVAEIAAAAADGNGIAAVVLLREKVFGSIYSATCSSDDAASWTCSSSQLFANGNTTNFAAGCTIRVLPSTSRTSTAAVSLVATCNDNNQTAAAFVASVSRSSKSMTQFWQQLTPSSALLLTASGGALVHLSPVISVPAGGFATSSSLTASSSYVHVALASFVETDGSSADPSVALVDLTAATQDPSSAQFTVVADSAVALTPSVCPPRAFNGAQDMDTDVSAATAAETTNAAANCSCCHGWLVDPNVRSAAALVDPSKEIFINGTNSPFLAPAATQDFVSFIFMPSAGGSAELAGSLLHINATFKNFHLAAAASRSASLTLTRVPGSTVGGPLQLGFGGSGSSTAVTLSWNQQQQKGQQRELTSAISTGYGPSFFVASSPALGNATVVLAIHNGSTTTTTTTTGHHHHHHRPVLVSFVSRLSCPTRDANSNDNNNNNFDTSAVVGVFVNSSTIDDGADSDVQSQRLSHYIKNSVALACRTEQQSDTVAAAPPPSPADSDQAVWRNAQSVVSIIAADGGSWSSEGSSGAAQSLMTDDVSSPSSTSQTKQQQQVTPSTFRSSFVDVEISIVRDDFNA